MTIGVTLSDKDLAAIKMLAQSRWHVDIKNWKERNTDYCLWFVTANDNHGHFHTKTGHSLAEIIEALLKEVSNGH